MSLLSTQLEQLAKLPSLPDQILDLLAESGKPLDCARIFKRLPVADRQLVADELESLCSQGRIERVAGTRRKHSGSYRIAGSAPAADTPQHQPPTPPTTTTQEADMPKQTVTIPAFGAPIPPGVMPNEEPEGEIRFVLHDDMRMTFYVAGEAVLTIPKPVTGRIGKMLQRFWVPYDPSSRL